MKATKEQLADHERFKESEYWDDEEINKEIFLEEAEKKTYYKNLTKQ